MSLRVLLIEDHLPLAQSIVALLEAQTWEVDFAANGAHGLALALQQPPDLMVLDLALPGLNGLELCAQLRERSDRHIAVLMLTARDSLDDRLTGFAAGADDYLVKPFAGAELIARCRALSKRFRSGDSHAIELGSLRFDRAKLCAYRDNKRLDLTRLPLQILRILMEAHPRVVTRTELIDALWPDAVPESDPLRSHLHSLRLSLDRGHSHTLLKSVHGVGYRLDIAL